MIFDVGFWSFAPAYFALESFELAGLVDFKASPVIISFEKFFLISGTNSYL